MKFFAIFIVLFCCTQYALSLVPRSVRVATRTSSPTIRFEKTEIKVRKDASSTTINSTPENLNFLNAVKKGSVFTKIALASVALLACNQPAMASTLLDSVQQSSGADSGFVQSFLLIFISEIGDKTFFIAGLLAAKYGRLLSFTGSIGALAVMTVISTILGQLFHAVPESITNGKSIIFIAWFH